MVDLKDIREEFKRAVLLRLRREYFQYFRITIKCFKEYKLWEQYIRKFVDEMSDDELHSFKKDLRSRLNCETKVLNVTLLFFISKGDGKASEFMEARYLGFAYSEIRTFLGIKNKNVESPVDIDKIVLEEFENLLKKAKSFNPEKGIFSGWFSRILIRRTKHELEKLKKNEALPIARDKDYNDYADNLISDILSPSQAYEREQLGKNLLIFSFKAGFVYEWKLVVFLAYLLSYKPQRIIDEFLDLTIGEIFLKIKKEFYEQSERSSEFLDTLFDPLEEQIKKKTADSAIPLSDHTTKDIIGDNGNNFICDLTLRDCLPKNEEKFSANISAWSLKIIENLQKEFTDFQWLKERKKRLKQKKKEKKSNKRKKVQKKR